MRIGGVLLTHDLFARGGGLGAAAARAYETLSDWPRSTTQLAEMTNVHLRSVQRALPRLAARDLAVETSGGWIRGAANIDEVAKRRGSAGAGADLQERHRQERVAWRGHEVTSTGSLRFVMKDTSTPGTVCAGATRSGAPCRAWAQRSTGFCVKHTPVPLAVAPVTGASAPWDLDELWATTLEAEIVYDYEQAAYSP